MTETRTFRVGLTVTVAAKDRDAVFDKEATDEERWLMAAEDAFYAVYADGSAIDVHQVVGGEEAIL